MDIPTLYLATKIHLKMLDFHGLSEQPNLMLLQRKRTHNLKGGKQILSRDILITTTEYNMTIIVKNTVSNLTCKLKNQYEMHIAIKNRYLSEIKEDT